MDTDAPEKKLNVRQKEAVEHGDGPLLIIAGAGTGKTTVITERIRWLITTGKARPDEILALTFTEKAAREMEDRVDRVLPYGYTQMWISTFHTFCDRVLRQEAVSIGLNPAYRLITDTDATMLMRRHLFDFPFEYYRPLGNPTKFIGGILQHFSRLSDEDISPSQYLDWAEKKLSDASPDDDVLVLEASRYRELSRAYSLYGDIKAKEGVLDFGDLIVRTLDLFRRRKNIRESYRRQFKYIFVDEFQDTNIAQNELVKTLAGKTGNITAVCDDDQSIYKFRGAAVSNVLSFRSFYPGVRMIVLNTNYRSTQEILDSSYRLIRHNDPDRLEIREGIDKKLLSAAKRHGEPPSLLYFDRADDEADAVAKKIRDLHSEGKRSWSDCAILVRANNHHEPFVRALSRYGIPYQFLGPGRLYRRPEVRDLISYLHVLHNFDDSIALYRVLSMSQFGISARDLSAISNFAYRINESLFVACEIVAEKIQKPGVQVPLLDAGTPEKLGTFVDMVHRHLSYKTKESAGQILYYFLKDTGLVTQLLSGSGQYDDRTAQNVSAFFRKIKSFESDHPDADVTMVLDWIGLSMEIGESPMAADTDWTGEDAVNILSVHSAKGLEFPVVFLVNLVSARFPTSERRDQIPIPDELIKETTPEGDHHLQEERRLFYVGMTRAKDLLYLTAANFYGDGKRTKKLSPFVAEALGPHSPIAAKQPETQLSFLDWKDDDGRSEKHDAPIQHVTYLSYSRIDAFRTCPMHYKLRYILGIPAPQSASLSLGTSVHAALRDFYTAHMRGSSGTKNDLLSLLDTHWRSDGYRSKAHERDMRKRGREYLSNYFDHAYAKDVQVLALEQSFTVPIVIGGRTVKIGGRIDRIDGTNDGGVEIVDYKTGTQPEKPDPDSNLQLSMYAIAASETPGLPSYGHPERIKLTLRYLETGKTFSTTRTAAQLADEKAAILAKAQEIESSDFRCSGGIVCRNCEYRLFCGG